MPPTVSVVRFVLGPSLCVEVQFGKCLSTTIKSAVYLATWRGLKAMAEFLVAVNAKRGKPVAGGGEDGEGRQARLITN